MAAPLLRSVIGKTFAFEASHRLDGLPEGHQCGRLHGHSYSFTVELAGQVDGVGFVVDYGQLQPIKDLVDAELDHRHLNHVLQGSPLILVEWGPLAANPTAERLAWWLFQRIWPLMFALNVELLAVRVSETAKTFAEYRPPPAPPRLTVLPLSQVA